MKKVLLSIALAVFSCVGMLAGDVVFDLTKPADYGFEAPANDGQATNVVAGKTLTQDNVVLTVISNAGTSTRFWNSNGNITFRVYKNGGSFSIATTNGEEITKIEFTTNQSNAFTVDKGTFSGKTWTGNASAVTFTVTNGNNITKITVTTVASDGVAAPVAAPAGGTYYETKEVTLSCGTEGASIFYTTDGTEPTAESTAYTAPIQIGEGTTTLKAVAVKGDKVSQVLTETYVVTLPVAVDNIAAAIAANSEITTTDYDLVNTKGCPLTFNGTPTVIYQNSVHLFVKDETGFIQIYGNVGQTYNPGDVLPAGFNVVFSNYYGLYELSAIDGFQAATTSVEAPQPEAVADVTALTLADQNKYISLEGVTVENGAIDGVALYNAAGVAVPSDGDYDIVAFVSCNKGTVQIAPVSAESKRVVNSVAELLALEDNTTTKVNVDLTVVYVNGKNIYTQDDEGHAVLLYDSNNVIASKYEAGDVIPAGFNATRSSYNGAPQVVPVDNFADATVHGVAVEPAVLALEEIGSDMHAKYVKVEGFNLLTISGKNYNVVDADGTEGQLYNQFNINMDDVKVGPTYSVVGLVNYNSKNTNFPISIRPTEIIMTSDLDDEEGEGVEVTTDDDEIIVIGAEDYIIIITPDGRRVTTIKGAGEGPGKGRHIVEVGEGIYIVYVDGVIVKVLVQ